MDSLRKLADKFKAEMESCITKKHLMAWEYWAGKEKAFYEAWRAIEDEIKELKNEREEIKKGEDNDTLQTA